MLKNSLAILLGVFIVISSRGVGNREGYKQSSCSHLGYTDSIKEKPIANLRMIGTVNKFGVQGNTKNERLYGAVLRALRFQDVTEKVEAKYGLPSNLVLAMVIQETGGADILPNGRDDGGLGLCHMQPSVAKRFSLKTYNDCDKLVSKSHGQEIRSLIVKYKYDRKKLIAFDDRFHPIKNLDAVGRILAYHMSGTQTRETKIKTGINGYAGRYNYSKYYTNVMYFKRLLDDKKFIEKVRKEFNRRNTDLVIGDEKGDFDLYIKTHQDQNINYGLGTYE